MKRFLYFLIPLFGMVFVVFVAYRLLVTERGSADLPGELILYCGTSLYLPVSGVEDGYTGGGIVDFFTRRTGIRVEVNHGASGLLLERLLSGREGDLFLPCDDFYIREADKAGLIDTTRDVIRLVPVIIVRSDIKHRIRGVSDLADPDIRLATADPDISAVGRILPKMFQKNGVDFNSLRNIAFTGATAVETAIAVEQGRADAAIVWKPVALYYGHNAELMEIPENNNVVSPVSIAVLTTSRNREAALRFADFIAGPAGLPKFAESGEKTP